MGSLTVFVFACREHKKPKVKMPPAAYMYLSGCLIASQMNNEQLIPSNLGLKGMGRAALICLLFFFCLFGVRRSLAIMSGCHHMRA